MMMMHLMPNANVFVRIICSWKNHFGQSTSHRCFITHVNRISISVSLANGSDDDARKYVPLNEQMNIVYEMVCDFAIKWRKRE